ncbi:IS1595 family transposase [Pseudorhodoplanes sp.]|uniref:IS1595 family transposase n=1 Tax=Pseudorhodoplanes sp. TaxID=1934341 RepID=UPI002B6EA79D|nr:IS1595 family transposase [Pseudorhodoplanes sp.]HWV52418.1 IS1595 family transposase [Pseudorhodoplanes sp.]
MATKGPNIREFQKRFPDEDTCLTHLMRTRYGERFSCLNCQKEATFYRVKNRRCFECEHCGYQVYPTAGTPFEKTRTPLRDWFFVMFLFCASRNGVAAKEVERQLGVTYKTAWRMCFLIRGYMGYVDGDTPMGGPGGGIVEVDKTFIGGKDKRGEGDKSVVLGMVERGGDVVTRHVADRTAYSVVPQIRKHVKPGSFIHTDEAAAFRSLTERHGYAHETVDHSEKEYVRFTDGEPVDTNTIEAFWSQVKRGINGTYISVSKKYLQTYLREFEYRHNLRHAPYLMFDCLLAAFPKVQLERP